MSSQPSYLPVCSKNVVTCAGNARHFRQAGVGNAGSTSLKPTRARVPAGPK